MSKKEESVAAVATADEPSPPADTPGEQAASFVQLAIDALGQYDGRNSHYEAWQFLIGKLVWAKGEIEKRL